MLAGADIYMAAKAPVKGKRRMKDEGVRAVH